MKNRLIILSGILTAIMVVSCSKQPKITAPPYVPTTGSYLDDSRSIDSIVVGDRWTQELYSEIDNAIAVDCNYGRINLDEMVSLYKKILNRSSEYAREHVDALLKGDVVPQSEVTRYDNMNNFLTKQYSYKHSQVNKKIDSGSEDLNLSKDMIKNFKDVCGWSLYNFEVDPFDLYNPRRYYAPTCADVEKRMHNNKYWTSHFKGNKDFAKAIPQFPSRRASAQQKFYTQSVSKVKADLENCDYSYSDKVELASACLKVCLDDAADSCVNRLKTIIGNISYSE